MRALVNLDWNSASNSTTDLNDSVDWGLEVATEFTLPSNAPSDYSHLAEVFSKQRVTTLPPHRTYDFSIDLQPDTIRLQKAGQ